MRQDSHRPSVIQPDEYVFVAHGYQKEVPSCWALEQAQESLRTHMAQTGGTFSTHAHGGSCHICGASFLYYQVFWHAGSNSYIRVGNDCAEKLGFGDVASFRTFRQHIADVLARKAGRAKAAALWAQAGLSDALSLAQAHEGTPWQSRSYEVRTIQDILDKTIRYGGISEKQVALVARLYAQEQNRPAVEAARAAERAAAADCPSGRVAIVGEVVKLEERDTQWGTRWVMVVKSDAGFLVWGTAPSEVRERGQRVRFTATVEPSQKDPKFGFFKRPAGLA